VIFFTISTPVEVVYAEHTLHVGAGGYGAIVARIVRFSMIGIAMVAIAGVGTLALAKITPTGFLPEDDQGAIFVVVQLPGRTDAAEATRTTLDDYVAAIVDAARGADFDEIVLVGHSLAGLTIPLAAAELGRRTVHLVYVSALVAGEDTVMTNLLPSPLRQHVAWHLKRTTGRGTNRLRLPRAVAKWYFCHDMSAADTEAVLGRLCAEPVDPMIQPLPPTQLTLALPRTYIGFAADRVVPRFVQRRMAAKVGAQYLTSPGGHDGLFNHPAPLASLLNELAGRSRTRHTQRKTTGAQEHW